jgi:hypothetical protein
VQSNVVVGSSASSSTPNPVSSNVAAVSQKAKIHSPQTMADQPEEADAIEVSIDEYFLFFILWLILTTSYL